MPTLLAPPAVDDATRREFLAGLAAAGLLAACGDSSPGDQTTPPGPARRAIEHPGGTSEIPVRPERVVTLSEAIDGHLTSVGLVPVGAAEGVQDWVGPYRELLDAGLDLAAIVAIGTTEEPNPEAIARLSPDLILAEVFSEDLYGTLSRIAPTVLIDRPTNADWKAAFDATTDAAGRSQEAEAVRARYRDVLDEVSTRSGSMEISFVRSNGDGTFRMDGTGNFAGSVAAEARFSVTDPPAGVADESGDNISEERLDVVIGDLIVLPSRRLDLDTVAVFEANPLWTSLPAVQAGRVVALPNPVYNGGTYVAAELLLEAIGRAVG